MLTSRSKYLVLPNRPGSLFLICIPECWLGNWQLGAKIKDKEVPSTPYSEYRRPGMLAGFNESQTN